MRGALLIRAISPKLRIVFRLFLYLGIYIGIIAAVLPNSISVANRLVFILYALFVFWILYEDKKNPLSQDQNQQKTHWIWHGLFLFAILYLVYSRLHMFLRYGEAPLGYDTGFYWQYFHLIFPGGNIGTSTGSHLAYASWFPFGFFKLEALTVIHLLQIFHQFLTAGALYFLLRSLPLKRASYPVSVIGVLLFALSVNQFMAYWWMFYKQSEALPFLIFAIALFIRRSILALPVAAFAAAIHLSSAIPLGGALILFILLQMTRSAVRRKLPEREWLYLTIGGLAAIGIFLALRGANDIHYYLNLFLKYKGLASNARSWEIEQIRGLFLPASTFRLNTLFYIPFAVIGFLHIRSWLASRLSDRATLLPITLGLSLVLVSFPFIHQNRSLVFFDILLIIFAAHPLYRFVSAFLNSSGKFILILLSAGILAFAVPVVWNHEPQLYADEAAELKMLKREGLPSDIRKLDDYVMVTSSFYTPWAYAFTGFEPTIVPGWLTWDKWDYGMWETFWSTDDNRERLNLLRVYGDHKIYIFIGRHVLDYHSKLRDFFDTDPHFTKLSPHIWKYSPVIVKEDNPPSISPQ